MTSRKTNLLTAVAVIALTAVAGTYAFTKNAEAEDAKNAAATAPAAGAPAKEDGKTLKQAIKADAVYAKVNGEDLTGKDVQAFVAKLPEPLQNSPADRLLELIVNQLVNDRLVAKEASESKLADDPKTQERIKAAQEQIIRDRYVEKALDGKVTDAQVKAKYNEMVKAIPDQDEIHARHILVADEKTAKEVIAKVNKGDDFAALAKQYSTDATKDNGGDLGYFVQSAMVKEFGDAVFGMKKGEVTKEPIKTQFGYHIIKVEDRRKMAKPTFDQIKDRVRAQLTEEQVRKLVEDLRAKNKVEITIPKA